MVKIMYAIHDFRKSCKAFDGMTKNQERLMEITAKRMAELAKISLLMDFTSTFLGRYFSIFPYATAATTNFERPFTPQT